jgi:uncharacterized membrane protein
MITFTNVIHIERSVEQVYAYLSDLENTPRWNWAITETKKSTPGPIAVGTRYRQTRSVPRQTTEYLEISALEPNRRIEVQGTLAQLPAHLIYELNETETGTELVNTVRLEPQGALRLVGSILGSRIEHAVAENLGTLEALLESDSERLDALRE